MSDNGVSRSNGPSAAVLLAAESLLGAAVKGDRDAAMALIVVPANAWPDALHRTVAEAITELTANGSPLELPILLARLTRAEVSPSRIGDLAAAPATCQPERLAALIRDEWTEREQRRFHDLRARGALSAEELRTCLADLALDTPRESKPARVATDTAPWFNTEPAPIECLFENRIPRGEICLLVAPGGRGKSLLVAGLLVSAATGRTLYPSFVPSAPSRILWWSSEDGEKELHRRVYRIRKAFNLDPEDCAVFVQNARVYAVHGKPLVDRNGLPTPDYRWLRGQVEAFRPHMIVLDPLAHFNTLDENDNGLMSVFMDYVGALVEASGVEATVILLHHTSKALENSGTSASARGASAIRDHARVAATLTDLTPAEVNAFGVVNPRLFVKAEIPKLNHLPQLETPIHFMNVDGAWREVNMLERKQETAQAGRLNLVQALVQAVGENPDNLTTYEIWHEPAGKPIRGTVATAVGKASRDDIRLALQDAIDAGILTTETTSGAGKTGTIPRVSAKSPVNRPFGLAESETYE